MSAEKFRRIGVALAAGGRTNASETPRLDYLQGLPVAARTASEQQLLDEVLRVRERAIADIQAQNVALLAERDEAREYLSRLLVHNAPECEPLDDLHGVCTQIDNLLCGDSPTMMPDTIASVQDRCRVGCSTLDDYHDLAADAYACIGQLQAEVERLEAAMVAARHKLTVCRIWGGMGWSWHPPQVGHSWSLLNEALLERAKHEPTV